MRLGRFQEWVTTLLTEARSTAQIEFDCNRCSVPPKLARRTVTVVTNADTIRILHEGIPVAEHRRSYGKRESIIDSQHRIDALQLRRRQNASDLEKNVGALGEEARAFQLALSKRPVRPAVHLKRIVALVNLYGRETVLQAMRLAMAFFLPITQQADVHEAKLITQHASHPGCSIRIFRERARSAGNERR